MSRAVVLLKSPPRDLADDAYVREFLTSGYKTYFIQVLDSILSNTNRLQDVIRTGPTGYVGVVVTSNRAADAWTHALEGVDTPDTWSHVPFYVVGEATARSLRHTTSLVIGAAQSGKSESLAQFVLTDLSTRSGMGKLLYLTGDKNRDTFNNIMSESGVDVENLCVYETIAASNLENEIDAVAREIEHEKHATPTWIVSFAPSSADIAIPHLGRHFRWSGGREAGMPAKLAAIGPTTGGFLRTERHFKVDAVALKPNAEQLVQAIRDADRDGD